MTEGALSLRLPSRVLVVDDDLMLRNLLVDLLSHEGYSVELAIDGEDALRKLESESFDLVITDVIMPGISGIDVLRHARRLYPDIDVIVMTGYASVDTAIHSIRLGAVDYVTKPFNIEHIRVLVAKTIEIGRLQRLHRLSRDSSDLVGVDLSTGLYNRKLFLNLLQREVSLSARRNEPVSVIVVGILEIGGASSGESPDRWQEWIMLSSWSLRRCTLPEYHLGYIGPATFGIVLPGVSAIDVIVEREQLGPRIQQELRQRTPALAARLGSASYPVDAQDPRSLLHIAEQSIRGSEEESTLPWT